MGCLHEWLEAGGGVFQCRRCLAIGKGTVRGYDAPGGGVAVERGWVPAEGELASVRWLYDEVERLKRRVSALEGKVEGLETVMKMRRVG